MQKSAQIYLRWRLSPGPVSPVTQDHATKFLWESIFLSVLGFNSDQIESKYLETGCDVCIRDDGDDASWKGVELKLNISPNKETSHFREENQRANPKLLIQFRIYESHIGDPVVNDWIDKVARSDNCAIPFPLETSFSCPVNLRDLETVLPRLTVHVTDRPCKWNLSCFPCPMFPKNIDEWGQMKDDESGLCCGDFYFGLDGHRSALKDFLDKLMKEDDDHDEDDIVLKDDNDEHMLLLQGDDDDDDDEEDDDEEDSNDDDDEEYNM